MFFSRYIQLFNEKAEELHETKEKLSQANKETKGAQTQVQDLQDREEELQNLLGKTRSSLEEEYRSKAEELRKEVNASAERAAALDLSLEEASARYIDLQESYRSSVQSLGKRLGEITTVLREHHEREALQREVTMERPQNDADESSSQPSVVLSDDSAVVCDRKKVNEIVSNTKDEKASSKKKKAKRKRKAKATLN